MTISKDFGPFAGMTYAGRQLCESSVKQASSLSKTALLRTAERRKDTPSPENIVVAGRLAYAQTWQNIRADRLANLSLYCLAIFFLGSISLLVTLGLAGIIDFVVFAKPTKPGETIIAILAMISCGGMAIASAVLLVRDISHGFDPSHGSTFAYTARQAWGIGDKALYIVERKLEDERTITTTVFYDAVGTVDLEQNEDGIDVVTLRSRDGSRISKFLDPVTSGTSNAKVIVDAISTRIASSGRR